MHFRREFGKNDLSARKLAAWCWQSQFNHVPAGNNVAGLGDQLLHMSKYELESCNPRLKCCKEEATKWDPPSSINHINCNDLLEDRKLRAEPLHVQRYIDKFQAVPTSFKKNLEQFFHPVGEGEEEFRKIQSVLDCLKDRLARERKSRKRMETLNRTLLLKLDEAHLSAKQFMKKYEEEKSRRAVMEEVCNELTKRGIEDKANIEELQKKLLEIREEAEEERITLKMSELWREEQVQMKLEDAKNVLEEWFDRMMQPIGNPESFLGSRGAESVNVEVQQDNSTIVDHKQKSSVVSASEGGRSGEGKSEGRRKWRDAMNPHVTRGMTGFVEWPPVNHKNRSKAINLEAQVRKQKSQLQLMLKPNA